MISKKENHGSSGNRMEVSRLFRTAVKHSYGGILEFEAPRISEQLAPVMDPPPTEHAWDSQHG